MQQVDKILSEWTQTALLLCAHFVAAKQKEADPLSPGEFNTLLKNLEGAGLDLPAVLDPKTAAAALQELRMAFDLDRLERLLGRGFLLSICLEKWAAQGIWICGRTDNG